MVPALPSQPTPQRSGTRVDHRLSHLRCQYGNLHDICGLYDQADHGVPGHLLSVNQEKERKMSVLDQTVINQGTALQIVSFINSLQIHGLE